jgi:putative exporter of polyketide antibiotics
VLVVAGLTAVLVGLVPRLSALAWVLVTWAVLSSVIHRPPESPVTSR